MGANVATVELIQRSNQTRVRLRMQQRESPATPFERSSSFEDRFSALFAANFDRLHRYLNRLAGDSDLAADLAQEAFVRLYYRGSFPDSPEPWLITVALNLFRNAQSSRKRRRQLLTVDRAEAVHSDPAPSPEQTASCDDVRQRVRWALDGLPERERHILLLRAEGYSYRDIAAALGLNDASVGVFLARAKRTFRESYEDTFDAP
jgi:RNA polymerase sigma factor (sigma-70 family)